MDAFARKPHEDAAVQRALQRFSRVLDQVFQEKPFSHTAATLTFRGGLFDELRDALRLFDRSGAATKELPPS